MTQREMQQARRRLAKIGWTITDQWTWITRSGRVAQGLTAEANGWPKPIYTMADVEALGESAQYTEEILSAWPV